MEQNFNISNDFSSLMDWLSNVKTINTKSIKDIIIEEKKQEDFNSINLKPEIKTNLRKCFTCKSKLSLVDELVSVCGCGYKFCSKHRMPELHICTKLEQKGQIQREQLEKNLVKLDNKKIMDKI